MTRRTRRFWCSAGCLFLLGTLVVGCKKQGGHPAAPDMAMGMAMEGAAYKDGADDMQAGPDAAAKTWQRSTLDTHRIRIEIGDDEVLPIDAMHMQVRVDGFRARVLLDVDFHSPHFQALEGHLQLRLPEGASPYFLAFGPHAVEAPVAPVDLEDPATSFEPEGIMQARQNLWVGPKQAVMVERDQARRAYRSEVAQRVDPAISEWAGSGVFDTKLYPIIGEQLHRVVIGYDVDLIEVGGEQHLPLTFPRDAGLREIDLEVTALPGAQVQLAAGDQAQAPSDKNAELLRWHLQDPPEQLELALRGANAIGLLGRDPGTGSYFAAHFTPNLPAVSAAKGTHRAVFCVDTSLSENPEKFAVWLDLLDAVLSQNRDEIGEFAVLFFNIGTSWWSPGFVHNDASQLAALRSYANTLSLEGATDLDAALREAARPSWLSAAAGDYDVFLLSDGAATWGEPDFERTLRELDEQLHGRVFAYRTGLPGTELGPLTQLARETGGAVFSVTGPDEVARAATAHRQQPFELLGVSVGDHLVDDVLVEGDPRYIYPGQALTFAGRLAPQVQSADDAPHEVSLRVRSLAGVEQTVAVKLPQVRASSLAPRVYGQIAVTALERWHELGDPRVDSLAYARHFRVNGRAASLLMLEGESDYQDAGLDLPAIAAADATKISSAHASSQLSIVASELEQLLGDPRASLHARLRRIEAIAPSNGYADLHALVDRLPRSAFEVEIPKLDVAPHRWAEVPPSVREQLQAREPEYDTFVAEAVSRRAQYGDEDALVLLSSLVEANPGDPTMARDVAFTARDWGLGAQVYELLTRVSAARPEEPQTYLALASLADELGADDLAMVYYELALTGGWDVRFGDYEEIAAIDYLRFLGQNQIDTLADAQLAHTRLEQLHTGLPVDKADLLVVMTWNTDNTDIDLHVKEPWGPEVYYSHPNSIAGGHLTRDVTTGYGPEMYYIPHARRGTYDIRAHYYSSNRNRLSTRTKVEVTIFRDFGTAQQTVERKLVTLEDDKDVHQIAKIATR